MLYFILGWLCICLIGCVLHFAFDWFHHNKFVAWLPAVNESTWEHLKIAFYPFLLWGILGGLVFNYANWSFAIFVGIIATFASILIIFYTYTHFTKKAILIVDIISFFIAVGIGVLCAYFIMTTTPLSIIFDIIGYIGIGIWLILFIVFSYYPPRNFLFKDPISNQFGIAGHNNIMCHHHHCKHCENKMKKKENHK